MVTTLNINPSHAFCQTLEILRNRVGWISQMMKIPLSGSMECRLDRSCRQVTLNLLNIRLHKLQLNEIKYILPALLSVSAVWRSAVASHWRSWYRTAQNRSSQISQIRRCPGSQYCSLVRLSPLLHSLSGNEVKFRSRVGLPKELWMNLESKYIQYSTIHWWVYPICRLFTVLSFCWQKLTT